MIRTILASVTHNPHYLTKYNTFITNCQAQNKSYKGYTEQHHICPRAMFPEFTSFSEFPWNCIALTPRQHYIAHLLLYKAYPTVSSQASAVYLMANTRSIKVNSKLYAKLKLEAIEANKGKAVVRDLKGNTSQVAVDDPRYLSGELVGVVKGKVTVKDYTGNTLQVANTDDKFLSGELKHINTGKVTVKDSIGNTLQVDNTDDKFLSGELKHINTGKVTVRDIEGNTFQVDKADPRYVSGELVGVAKGLIAQNRALNIEQVKEIRLAIKNPTTVITNEYLATVVKPSQRDKIGKIPFEELKYVNGHYLTYKSLLVKYYSGKFNIDKSSVTRIIDNKRYKEITV